MPANVTELLSRIAIYVINPVIVLGFVVATIYLFVAIIKLIAGASGGDLEKNKKNVMYGIIGLFVMFSVYGIIDIVLRTLNLK